VGRIPEETIQAIRDRVDIVDLVGRYVSLRQTGRSFKALCPFHAEKTPSFHVHPERQIFHCFGCGAGGNAFGFLMKHENLSFPEVVRVLGRECGVEVPEESGAEAGLGERLREANEVAQRLYRAALQRREGAAARAYLERRGLGSETIERFGLGFAPPGWDATSRALAAAGVSAAVGARAGLLAERERGGHYDRLRDRVTFPIRDVRGTIVGFGGRVVADDQEPKYLNTPESPIFRKREAFYGLPEALEPMRRAGRAIVVEGYFDLLALHRASLGEVVATCGTSLTAEHARNLRRRSREVILFFDGDEAGRRAMDRALTMLLPEGLRVRAVSLPAGDDPDSFLSREGPEALRGAVDAAPAALELAIQHAVARGCSSPWEKADVVGSVVRLLALVPEPVERSEFARRLALLSDTRLSDVDALVRREQRGEDISACEPSGVSVSRRLGPEGRFARRLVRLLINQPDQARRLDPRELSELVEAPPWDRVLSELAEACCSGRPDVALLAERLGGEAGALLLGIAAVDDEATEAGLDPERMLEDTLAGLRERRRARKRRALTRRLSEQSAVDAATLLEEKQRQLEERRASLGLTPHREPGRP
jgi:DNA primase